MWFHCDKCDRYSDDVPGFNELKHFVRCECGANMYPHRQGKPIDIYVSLEGKETKGRIVPQ